MFRVALVYETPLCVRALCAAPVRCAAAVSDHVAVVWPDALTKRLIIFHYYTLTWTVRLFWAAASCAVDGSEPDSKRRVVITACACVVVTEGGMRSSQACPLALQGQFWCGGMGFTTELCANPTARLDGWQPTYVGARVCVCVHVQSERA